MISRVQDRYGIAATKRIRSSPSSRFTDVPLASLLGDNGQSPAQCVQAHRCNVAAVNEDAPAAWLLIFGKSQQLQVRDMQFDLHSLSWNGHRHRFKSKH